MKVSAVLKKVTQIVTKVAFSESPKKAKLSALDKDVLEVALMVAALDGTILPEEYATFKQLIKKCKGYSAKNAKACLDSALRKAGLLMAMAQVGVYSEKERLRAFLKLAKSTLPMGFAEGNLANLRRAFALWVVMGVADGEFSNIERKAIEALKYSLSPDCRIQYGLMPVLNNSGLLEPEFITKVEKLIKATKRK